MGIPTFFNRMGGNSGPISPYDLLCFTANTDGSAVTLKKTGTPASGIALQYSTNKSKWNPCIVDQQLNLRKGQKLYFKGDNETFNTANDRYSFTVSGSVKVGGNIMSLLDETCEETEVPSTAFYGLFQNSVGLTDASKLTLPADVMTKECYAFMFDGCSSLAKAPELNAENLDDYCYQYMFRDCYALQKAPALPAIELTSGCYKSMFDGCSGLTDMTVSFFEWDASSTDMWVNGVAPTGVFRCPTTLSSRYGVSNIPTNWGKVENDAQPFYIKITGNSETTILLNYVGSVESNDVGHEEQDEGWDEPQEPIYHEAVTHWDDELQEEVIDEEEWWEEVEPIHHEGETHWVSEYEPIPPYNLEYSTDGVTWQSAEFNTEQIDPIGGNWGNNHSYNFGSYFPGDTIYIRGTNTGFYADTNTYGYFNSDLIEIGGNIMSLLDPTMKQTVAPENCFRGLFGLHDYYIANVASAKDLLMPATTLGANCYREMFTGNETLSTSFNKLPALTLGVSCYRDMFKGCTSLTEPPKIYANTLDYACCYGMFQGCTSLVKVPQMKNLDTLPEQCFCQMFYGCTALTGTLVITPHTFGNNACRAMYQNCTSITGHGSIGQNDSVMGTGALQYMFYGCTSFNPPHIGGMSTLLPMSGYSQQCFEGMFKDCTSLRETARLNGASVYPYSFTAMYSGCSSLIDASDCFHTGQKTPAQGCYNAMFQDCVNLTYSPHIYLSSLTNVACYEMFKGCSKLNKVFADFTEWDDEHSATNNWLSGVALTGTFYCPSNLDTTTRDASHVPDGWTVAAS